MWPIGHAAGAYILYNLYSRARGTSPPGEIAVWILLFGSLIPDIIDKPLAWYVGVLPTGRSLGHSLLFIVPLCIALGVIAYRYGRLEWAIAFTIGALSHLLLDALPALWRDDTSASFLLYPLVSVGTYDNGAPTILGLLRSSLNDPYFHLEFVFLFVALVMWVYDGYPGMRWLRGPFGDRWRQ